MKNIKNIFGKYKKTIRNLHMFKNQFNVKPSLGVTFTQPSLTRPEQTMSINEIVHRHLKGQPIPGNIQQKEPQYGTTLNDETYIFRNVKTLDLSELEEIRRDFKQSSDEYFDKIKKQQKLLTDEKRRKEIENEAKKIAENTEAIRNKTT